MQLNKSIPKRSAEDNVNIEGEVRKILNDVKNNGDKAVKKYSKKFDNYTGKFKVSNEVACDEKFMNILERAKEQIEIFHEKQINHGYKIVKRNGVVLGQIARPLQRVAVYVPGGTAAYPSTVLMNVIPAKLAGVPEIAIFCPNPNDDVLMAAKVCGIDTIYKIGGVQAIAAAAYGTETIPKFDKIVGPGNSYVATAKRLVYGQVDIDMVAGPSEILIIADESANPKYIAADLMSQAEHDKMASAILITTSRLLILQVENELDAQLTNMPRKEIIMESLENYGAAILVNTIEEAIALSNEIAPEHLEILLDEPKKYLQQINNAGSIFLGEYSPEPLGDYMSGTNHVLPTSGTARFYSPLGVYDFTKLSSFSYYPKDVLKTFEEDVEEFAKREGLEAHANSIRCRFTT